MTIEDLNPCTFCQGKGSTEIVRDIGWDVCGDGEEHQHLERCSCGAERMVADFFTYDHAKTTTFYGSWTKYQDGDEAAEALIKELKAAVADPNVSNELAGIRVRALLDTGEKEEASQ